MATEIYDEWCKLPEHLWVKILNNLDVTSILRATETCKTLNTIIVTTIIMEKIKLTFNINLSDFLFSMNKMDDFALKTKKNLENSKREYRIVELNFTNQPLRSSGDYRKLASAMIIRMFKKFSYGVRKVYIKDFDKFSDNTSKFLIKILRKQNKFPTKYFVENSKFKYGLSKQIAIS